LKQSALKYMRILMASAFLNSPDANYPDCPSYRNRINLLCALAYPIRVGMASAKCNAGITFSETSANPRKSPHLPPPGPTIHETRIIANSKLFSQSFGCTSPHWFCCIQQLGRLDGQVVLMYQIHVQTRLRIQHGRRQ
jgi:hypothetical protein